MAIVLENGFALPDVPADILAQKPYYVIMSFTGGSTIDDAYLLMASASVFGLGTPDVLVSFNLSENVIASLDTTYRQFQWDSANDTWTEVSDDYKVSITNGFFAQKTDYDDAQNGVKYRTVWSNHDIKLISAVDSSYNLTWSDSIYFCDSTFTYPDLLAVPGTWLKGMAEQVRRITKAYARQTYDAMLDNLNALSVGAITMDELLIKKLYNGKIHYEDGSIATLESEDVTSIESYCYQDFTNFTGIIFPNVTEIGDYAFDGCTNLRNVELPNVTTIGQGAFIGTGLAKIDLPKLSSTGTIAFVSCPNLETVILRNADAICTIPNKYVFRYSPIYPDADGVEATGHIYVPSALVDSYKADSVWSTYANQIRAIEDYPDICGTT